MTTRLRNKLATAHEQVVEAYRNGATIRQIGEVHGVSAGTVRNLLIELDEPMRNRGRRKKDALADPRILPLDTLADESETQPDRYEGDFS